MSNEVDQQVAHAQSPGVSFSGRDLACGSVATALVQAPREPGTCCGDGGIFAVCPQPGPILTSVSY